MNKIIHEFINYYEKFDPSETTALRSLYSKEVEFIDPFHTMFGIDNLQEYFQRMMLRVESCNFIVSEYIESNDSAVIIWKMILKHPRLDKKNKIVVNGNTHIKFNNKIYYHRDYFDSSELIYRRVPILKTIIKLIEKRI